MRRRLVVLVLSTVVSSVGLFGLASHASAYCIETGTEFGCVNPCPPGPWYCLE